MYTAMVWWHVLLEVQSQFLHFPTGKSTQLRAYFNDIFDNVRDTVVIFLLLNTITRTVNRRAHPLGIHQQCFIQLLWCA